MKFSIAFAVLAAVVATVGAAPVETNAQRMARGLPPKAPARRATPAFGTCNSVLTCSSSRLIRLIYSG